MRRFTMLSAAAAVTLTAVIPGAASASEATGPAREPVSRIELLRLECRARVTDSNAAVRCEWTAPTSAAAASVKLFRFDPTVDEHRQVVYRSGELGTTSFADVGVRLGHRYAYAVIVVNAEGRVVGRSRAEWVRVPGSVVVEVMRLDCRQSRSRATIGCEWSRPETSDAAVVSLWRSVNGGTRELVERFRPSGPNAYRDPVPADATHVTYTVIATSESDRIVARSRQETVRIVAITDRTDRLTSTVPTVTTARGELTAL